MLDTVLNLSNLNDKYAAFVGNSREVEVVDGLFGGTEHEVHYPAILVSREMWEMAGRPVSLRVELSAYVES